MPVALQRHSVAVGARFAPWLRSICLWPAAPRALRASRRRRRSKKGRPSSERRSERRPGCRDAPKLLQRRVAARHVAMRCAVVDSAVRAQLCARAVAVRAVLVVLWESTVAHDRSFVPFVHDSERSTELNVCPSRYLFIFCSENEHTINHAND